MAEQTGRDAITGRLFTGTDGPWESKSTGGAVSVTTSGAPATMDVRIVHFNAAADMPADITSAANVTADRVGLNTFNAAVRRVDFIYHGLSGSSVAASVANPAAIGAIIAINSDSDADANARLVYDEAITGGGTSSATADDRVILLSPSNPKETVTLSAALNRVDLIGIPNVDTSATNSSFVEVRAYY